MLARSADGIRLTVPVAVGEVIDEVAIEAGLLERLHRIAAFIAFRDGLLGPGEEAVARLVPGPVRAWHGAVQCLDSCQVELRRPAGDLVSRTSFSREVFLPFALARATHRLAAVETVADRALSYSLHAVTTDEAPAPVVVPVLPAMSIAGLIAGATRWGEPAADWIVTVITAAAARGLGELETASRARGVETAGRLHTHIGFDPTTRCYVRVLDVLVPALDTAATATTVRSTASSWGEFLATRPGGASVASSAHTHVHLDHDGASVTPCISVQDLVTHYVTFQDPLSAALIVSVFPASAEVRLYGYTPAAVLREEPGWWMLPEDAHAR